MKHARGVLSLSLCLLIAPACSEKKSDTDQAAVTGAEEVEVATPGTADPVPGIADDAAAGGIPAEVETLELDLDGNAIPATIVVPKGATIFADEATSLRISQGKGETFGVQVVLGNEYNTNLEETAAMLEEGGYGSTHEILERTDRFLRWISTADGHSSQSFNLLIDLKGTTWVCKQGNRGGWDESQIAEQIAACQTLKAR